MDMVILFVKALAIGLALAAPVGPVGLICIRRAITLGRLHAMVSGFGAAVADSLYAAVAAFGLTGISGLLIDYQTEGRLIGGAFLLYLALKFLRKPPASTEPEQRRAPDGRDLLGGFVSILLLTITNPATIATFGAIFIGAGFLQQMTGGLDAVILVLGVFLGSALWWVILAFAATALKARLGERLNIWANIAAAVLIGGFGLAAITSVIM